MYDQRLLSAKDWDRLRHAMESMRDECVMRRDARTGYVVKATVEPLTARVSKIRGHGTVLTVWRRFENGNEATQNFNCVEEARSMLYG